MSIEIVGKRYANALFQLGQEQHKLEQFEEELRIVREVFHSNKPLMEFLKHPRVELHKKKQLLKEAFQGFSNEVTHTLELILDRHREAIIPTMVSEFIHLNNEARGIAEAEVYSVRSLSKDEEETIQTVFAKKLQKDTLRIHNIVDPSILGGLKLKIGNRIYDGSVSGKLERIERELVSGNN
ncbi:F0F1 ATP synthase subunit delta [Pontibacillus litoralis]|uniref:ATP synthase subunit delta n=1 Tax=Pontibacillus litoralis JSM 072002 TaxID=1385512 RepID=A0A0A5HS39_9BACI|nr:F0F1 ATP synthase subunit delta [Pontibacillus litoralis]KGX86442.1 F0F1 ATP synthase subunit delta [Pontibacillus litoralis JSM 072002]